MRHKAAALAIAGAIALLWWDAELIGRAFAEWKPEYAAAPAEVQAWYRNAELTAAAQRRFPFKKCCDHADVVRTRFQVNRTDAGDEWFYEDAPGHWKRIPPDIIHVGESAPGGGAHAVRLHGAGDVLLPGRGRDLSHAA